MQYIINLPYVVHNAGFGFKAKTEASTNNPTGGTTMNLKRKLTILCLVLPLILLLSSCVGKTGNDPITAIELGFTQEQALEKEPTLSEYDEHELSCERYYADTKGTLLVYFNALEGAPEAMSIKWIAEPTDGMGKATYDALFSSLKKCYGKPKISRDNENVEGDITGTHSEAQARWDFDAYSVSVSYIYYPDSGKCQILYHRTGNVPVLS